tara:strand:- start:309 stop:653 length:345 start_codon:yes stop_codon:yes gene_type:complete
MNTVIYSNPFLINEYDHQYRVTICEDTFTFDYVKCNEEVDDLDMCVILEKTYLETSTDEVKKMIDNKIDFRTQEKISDTLESKENENVEDQNLHNSCIFTINELYSYLVENYFN